MFCFDCHLYVFVVNLKEFGVKFSLKSARLKAEFFNKLKKKNQNLKFLYISYTYVLEIPLLIWR